MLRGIQQVAYPVPTKGLYNQAQQPPVAIQLVLKPIYLILLLVMQTQCLLKSDQKIEEKEISVFRTFHILQMHNMCKEIFAMKFQCELYKCYVSLLTCFAITVFFALILLITCKHHFAKNAMMLNIL